MFAGSHVLTIDDKGRLAIPARFRQQLVESCGAQLVITMGPNTCLEIYPAPEFKRIADDIEQLEDRDAADLLKLSFIGRAFETQLDAQGRVVVPPMLRESAQLDGSAVIVGQIKRLDVWAEDAWKAKFGDGPQSIGPALKQAFRTIKR